MKLRNGARSLAMAPLFVKDNAAILFLKLITSKNYTLLRPQG
jgi:hypothetical protein